MFGILLTIHVLVTMLLIFVILIQKSEGGSSLFASGSGNGMFNARGTSSILTKMTWTLAGIFLLNCILMAHIASNNLKNSNTLISNNIINSSITNRGALPTRIPTKSSKDASSEEKSSKNKSSKDTSSKSTSSKNKNLKDTSSKTDNSNKNAFKKDVSSKKA